MTYAVQSDMVDRFGQTEIAQLTDRVNGTAIDTVVLGKALADADDLINSYLATRYTLPLSSTPKIIVRAASDIARFYLYEDRVTEAVKARYDDTVKYLKSVADGLVTLGLDAANQVATGAGGPSHDAGDRVFSQGRPSTGREGSLDDY